MKKVFLCVAAMLLSGFCSAQITSHSSNDANIDGAVDIADVNNVLNEMFGTASTIKQVVSADSINTRLKAIEDRLAVIEKKLGIEPEETHEYVDLGLPSKTMWATCNVGADSPEDYGLYFQWGESTGYTTDTSDGECFDWHSYKWCNSSQTTMNKYCTNANYWDSSLGTSPDQKSVLEPEDDAATAYWGSEWCMPTYEQFTELHTNCTWTWTTTENGVKGISVKGPNGNSIFLPAAGGRIDNLFSADGVYGYYWTRSLCTKYPHSAWAGLLGEDVEDDDEVSYCVRYYGFSVRPVRSE